MNFWDGIRYTFVLSNGFNSDGQFLRDGDDSTIAFKVLGADVSQEGVAGIAVLVPVGATWNDLQSSVSKTCCP